MRYLVGLALFLRALGTLRVVGCGDEPDEPGPESCDYASECDDQNVCTLNLCVYKTKTCKYKPIDCQDTVPEGDPECMRYELDVCDPEAPEESQACGDATYINA
jgi:hypothetical protein